MGLFEKLFPRKTSEAAVYTYFKTLGCSAGPVGTHRRAGAQSRADRAIALVRAFPLQLDFGNPLCRGRVREGAASAPNSPIWSYNAWSRLKLLNIGCGWCLIWYLSSGIAARRACCTS